MRLKENCFRVQGDEGEYFLKTYDRETILRKVKLVHDELCAIGFPYIQPVIVDLNKMHFRQDWVEGPPANYRYMPHRKQVYKMLKALHSTNKKVAWASKGFNRLQLIKKWQTRLMKFQACETIIRPFLQHDYDVIVKWAEQALDDMQQQPISGELTLLHGDVVHHNFLVGKQPLIIDFDLAILGPPIAEKIMFVQRVLPMVRYDWSLLLSEQPDFKLLNSYDAYLRFPNELLREWCYFAMSDEEQRGRLYFYVRKLTLEAKYYRGVFLRQLNANRK